MRRKYALILFAIAALLGSILTTTPAHAATSPWQPLWSDEFAHGLDTATWNVSYHVQRPSDSATLLRRNVWVHRGKLVMRARQEWVDGRPYTAAALDTYGTLAVPRYFMATVRAQVTQEQGMFPAPLWFRPANSGVNRDAEVDLIETIGREAEDGRATLHHTIHAQVSPKTRVGHDYSYAKLGDPAGTGWHTYTIRKMPGRIVYRTDGHLTALWRAGDPGWLTTFDADVEWALRVNLQVGAAWSGQPDARTDWRRTKMRLDYIRIYAWQPS